MKGLLPVTGTRYVEGLDSGRVRLYETGSRLPLGLLIEEEPTPTAAVLLYDEGGQLWVLLRAESRVAVARARERFADRLAEATELGGDVRVDRETPVDGPRRRRTDVLTDQGGR